MSAVAVKKSANAATAAQVRALSSRPHRLINVRQFFGGALGCQVSTAALMGAVPMSVSKKLVGTMSSPAKRKAKPGSTPSRTVMAPPRRIVGTKMAGNSFTRVRCCSLAASLRRTEASQGLIGASQMRAISSACFTAFDLRLLIHTPRSDSGTADKIERLLAFEAASSAL